VVRGAIVMRDDALAAAPTGTLVRFAEAKA